MTTPTSILVATAAAQALAKSIVETFITPKLVKLDNLISVKGKTHIHDYWKNQFSTYLVNYYEKYSIINTIAFNNQRRRLKDLYIPLTIVREFNAVSQLYEVTSYSDNLFPAVKKLLITDTAGMGKSTLTKLLFLSVIDQNKGIPVLIELRRLNKNKKVIDEIIDQLGTLEKVADKEFVFNIINRGDFIFFFDGYDEIKPEDMSHVTNDIQNFINKANKNLFVITSRPEESLVSFGDFIRFSISPLKNEEAFELLRKYNEYGELSKILITKIREVLPSVKEFLTNPLLVSLLYTAFEYKHTIPFKKHVFYRQVFDALFESHDLSKGDSFERSKIRRCVGLDIEDFHRILRSLGYECLKISKTEFTKDEMIQLINKSKRLCSDLSFKEHDFLKDITTSSPLFTVDGNYYKWSHKSLQEYFAAQFVHIDAKNLQSRILIKIITSQRAESYLNFLDLYHSIDPQTFENIVIKSILEAYVQFCNDNKFYNISDDEIEKRLELTFLNNYYIVYGNVIPDSERGLYSRYINEESDTDDDERGAGDEVTNKIFDSLIQKIGIDDASEYRLYPRLDNEYKKETKMYYTLLEIKPYAYILFLMFQKKQYNFFKPLIQKKLGDKFTINGIPDYEAIMVDSDPESVLNDPSNFKKVTDLLVVNSAFNFLLDLKKSQEFINRLNRESSTNDELMLNDL
ncbi:NACHT domain-containing protein [uncultured Spirosoma sp.]|uniref:NACHT domain-containing protein n=1 Tax=uncultured Spirosoma sp. TaxID=278208 RepID=UPI002588C7AF|nr:NACHT domain-containing protein [uncultured Spirosoma sp.]